MSYEEILKTLEKQIKNCNSREEYLKKQKEIALSSKDIATQIGIQIANVANKMKRLLLEDEIKVIEGLEDNRKKKYILTELYCEEKLWKK